MKPDIQAHFSIGALANLEDSLGARHVDGNWLLKIHMLSASDRGFEMLRVKVRGSRYDDCIHYFACGDLLIGVRTHEKLLRGNRCVAFCGLDFVKMVASCVELILEQVAERDNARASRVN